MTVTKATSIFCSLLCTALVWRASAGAAVLQPGQFTVKDLGMQRSDICRPDITQWIFNGTGRSMPCRWSMTGFTGLDFVLGSDFSHDTDGYRFRFDFVEKRSGVRIQDNMNENLESPQDPLGWNFRSGFPYCIVQQEDTWYPHYEWKTGSFCKNFKTGTVSFEMETRTIVPNRFRGILEEISIENRDAAPLTLTLLPMQGGVNSLQSLASDIETVKGQGLEWTIPPHIKQTHNFAIIKGLAPTKPGSQPVATYEANLADRVKQADEDGETQIRRIAGRLPVLQTSNKQLEDLYRRCIVSLAFCRWDYPGARTHPVWLAGGFHTITAWDFCFAADALSMVDPRGVRQIVADVLGIGQMRGSYIDTDTASIQYWNLYIMDPFALEDLIKSYIKITGDRTILGDVAGGHSVYDWLKLWAAKLDSYPKGANGLVDMRDDGNEFLLELRTDGYDHVVPTINGLYVEYLRWLSELAIERNDPDSEKYAQHAETLNQAFQALWDEKAGWFDNVYEDGSRTPVLTMHLFDMLGTSVLTEHERQAIASHFVEGEFLAPLGIYAISKKDIVHWDRFDQDWGGGGAYIGTPLRTAGYLYDMGAARQGWDVLSRTSRLAEHFSYMPQSPAMDEPYENYRGGTLDVASGAAFRTIWSGIFGLRPQPDGSVIVNPAPYNPEIGESRLSGLQFRGQSYDVDLSQLGWRVYVDGNLHSKGNYGHSITIPAAK